MALKQTIAVMVAVASLAGCSKMAGVAGGAVADVAGQQAASQPAPQAKAPTNIDQLSRAQIAAAGRSVMRVDFPARGLKTLLVARDQKAQITSWMTGDGMLFTFRDGLLIETRGFGADLMSSAVPSLADLRSGKSYGRSYFYVGPEDQTQQRDYLCQGNDSGDSGIVIYGQSHHTRRITEVCERPEGYRITNEYWLEGDMIRRSSQWAGPDLGNIAFERVID